jgi:hypothetical protein
MFLELLERVHSAYILQEDCRQRNSTRLR